MLTEKRNELIEKNINLAKKLAHSKARTTPKNVQIDELISAAYMGLVVAASHFKEDCDFKQYAAIRIKWAIQDYLRSLRWFSGQNNAMEEVREIPVFQNSGTQELLEDVGKTLNWLEKRVVAMYYIDQRTLREIGEAIDVTPARVSQILKQCRKKMQSDRERNHRQVA